MRILNLTQHPATPEQVAAGVVEPADKGQVQNLLTFDTLPTRNEICNRAWTLAQIAYQSGETAIMIGGAPYLMGPLESNLRSSMQLTVLYSFTQRVSEEQSLPDGTVKKTAVFKHVGWVEVRPS